MSISVLTKMNENGEEEILCSGCKKFRPLHKYDIKDEFKFQFCAKCLLQEHEFEVKDLLSTFKQLFRNRETINLDIEEEEYEGQKEDYRQLKKILDLLLN